MSTIKEIAEGCGMAYLFEDWARANVKADKVTQYPLMVDLLPVSGAFRITNDLVNDDEDRLFAFLDRTEFDFESTENDNIIQAVKRRALGFLKALNADGTYEPIGGNIPYSVIYDKLDENLTGITISVRLKRVTPRCLQSYD